MEEKREKSTPQKKQTDSSVSREKQSLWIIKNYLNLPQTHPPGHRQRPQKASV